MVEDYAVHYFRMGDRGHVACLRYHLQSYTLKCVYQYFGDPPTWATGVFAAYYKCGAGNICIVSKFCRFVEQCPKIEDHLAQGLTESHLRLVRHSCPCSGAAPVVHELLGAFPIVARGYCIDYGIRECSDFSQ